MTQRLSKNQLIKLVIDIMNANGTESEIDSWINIFKNHVAHSNASDLIFHPDRVPGIEPAQEITPEEAATMALAYKPITTTIFGSTEPTI
jgi:Colicin immunity protein / pyocin immunity protein